MTRWWSYVLDDAPPADADALVVAALRAAGAVIVAAKMHTQEFAHGPTGDAAATGPRTTRTIRPGSPPAVRIGGGGRRLPATGAGHRHRLQRPTPAAPGGVVGLKPTYGRLVTTGVPAGRVPGPRRVPDHRRRRGAAGLVGAGRNRGRRGPDRRTGGRRARRRLLAGGRSGHRPVGHGRGRGAGRWPAPNRCRCAPR